MDLNANNLSKIRHASVSTSDKYYKNIDQAIDEGFEVNWYANNYNYTNCSTKFHVWNPYNETYIENLCAYGIIYNAVWEYQYYN